MEGIQPLSKYIKTSVTSFSRHSDTHLFTIPTQTLGTYIYLGSFNKLENRPSDHD